MRLGIGWHFFQEGAVKIQDPSWTAAGFFTGSVGPLKPLFEMMVWDVDGKARLNYSVSDTGRPTIDLSRTTSLWDQHRARVADHYGFDDAQGKKAVECQDRWEGQLKWFFEVNHDDIVQYFYGLERRDANRQLAEKQEVASLREQANTIESELNSARAPWLKQVAKLWEGYDKELNAIATKEQRDRGTTAIGKPARGLLDTNTIDMIVPWFDAFVGVCLILGLGTRIAGLAGAGFLFSIILTQWPGAPGALPVYYQTIEMLAMLVLVAVAAGQFAGLDFVVYHYWKRFKESKQETKP